MSKLKDKINNNKQFRKLLPAFYFKNLITDQNTLKINKHWYTKVKNVQLKKNRALFKDRLEEIKEYFKVSHPKLIKYYLTKGGFPNGNKAEKVLIDFFENKTQEDKDLQQAYADSAYHYSIRQMLGYERFRFILPYMDVLLKELKKDSFRDLNILDYGCGVGDIGLLFASLGANITLVDLDDKKYDFGIWRFKRRGYNPEVIKIKKFNEYAKLKASKYDIILATEIFEHVRDPLKLLKILTKSLKEGGILMDSMGGTFERELVGDHLEEALRIGQSEEYNNYYNKNYTQIYKDNQNLKCLFKKMKK